jgi:hypothetical protein
MAEDTEAEKTREKIGYFQVKRGNHGGLPLQENCWFK